MTKINPENVLDQFDELIPRCAGHAELYLKALRQHLRAADAPVSTDVREERLTGGFRGPLTLCLVTAPSERRLRHFEILHFGIPVGSGLKVGWYLLGGVKAQGLGGWAILGGATALDADNVRSIVQFVHEAGVVPAMHEVAGAASGVGPATGFFNT